MAKSLKARLDTAIRKYGHPRDCGSCGIPLDMIMEMYVSCPNDSEEIEMIVDTSDVPRCSECGKPSQLLISELKEPRQEAEVAVLAVAVGQASEQVDHSRMPA